MAKLRKLKTCTVYPGFPNNGPELILAYLMWHSHTDEPTSVLQFNWSAKSHVTKLAIIYKTKLRQSFSSKN